MISAGGGIEESIRLESDVAGRNLGNFCLDLPPRFFHCAQYGLVVMGLVVMGFVVMGVVVMGIVVLGLVVDGGQLCGWWSMMWSSRFTIIIRIFYMLGVNLTMEFLVFYT